MANSNPRITRFALNAKGGAFTDIVMTMVASKVRVMEDPAYNNGVLQGLTGYECDTQPGSGYPNLGAIRVWLPNDQGQIGPAYEPISYGGAEGGRVHGGLGEYVGGDGTTILRLTTNAADSAGGVLLEEWA